MSAHHRRVNNALIRYRCVASFFAGLGTCAVLVAVLVGLSSPLAVGLAAMGMLLVAATVPLLSRAATLERQRSQLEAARARMGELQAARYTEAVPA